MIIDLTWDLIMGAVVVIRASELVHDEVVPAHHEEVHQEDQHGQYQ